MLATIITVFGTQQFMDVQAGCANVVHTNLNLLKSDHTYVVGKVNYFAILEIVRKPRRCSHLLTSFSTETP